MKNKILIFGATAIGIFDLRVTPFYENYPGAETHVNIVDNLVRRDFLKSHPSEDVFMPIILLLLGIFGSFALARLGAINAFLFTSTSLVATILIDKFYFFDNGYVITIVFPLFLLCSLYLLMTFYKYFTEEQNKKEVRATFQKYVSPSIVDELLKDPSNLELGGKKQHMTVFFSDIRGFTTISEKLDPKALSSLLNSYLTPMTELVFENNGTLDKYMGDAVMAFFGAPLATKDHAENGCRCALESLVKLKELQKLYMEQGLPNIDIGIGLNTGEMSVGNMGSETVRSYTVMGDAVNLGSRLEAINKQYGTRIIISEFTYAEVKDKFVCREIDWVKVKGKDLPVRIFELVGENDVAQETKKSLDHFNKGFDLYHEAKFKEAVAEFSLSLDLIPDDTCSKLYIDRCQDYIDSPPDSDWDGVFTMTTK